MAAINLDRSLMGDCRLLPELPTDVGREGNVGDDQGSRRHVGRSLLFQSTVELTYAAPFFGTGTPRLVGDNTTISSDQNVLHVGRRDIGASDLQPVDRFVDLVGEINGALSHWTARPPKRRG